MTEKDREILQRYADKNVSLMEVCKRFEIKYSTACNHIRRKNLKYRGKGIYWSEEKLDRLYKEFPLRFNKELARDLGVSWRTLVRKARSLGIEKDPDFYNKNRKEIAMRASANSRYTYVAPSAAFLKNSYKKGERPNIDYKAMGEKRSKAVELDRTLIAYGMKPKTRIVQRNNKL